MRIRDCRRHLGTAEVRDDGPPFNGTFVLGNLSSNFKDVAGILNAGKTCATLLQRKLRHEMCKCHRIKSFLVVHMREINFEAQERQTEILALLRMIRYAGGIANELDAVEVSYHIKAVQAALLVTLSVEFPMLTAEHLDNLFSDAVGHC